ncbi:Bor family protein [Aquiflexum sp. TKW24L]|uniref:Bor family protein n=1 Tax=Aquiflexum sp. TKW24L TaxID=2942212 RepID=UPI0020BD8EFB|nr:Bor family protein [Aquiflexum sp. TKW24L]MCL6259413.1 Bor family protein [Aquiflexum sp. TKW24L]
MRKSYQFRSLSVLFLFYFLFLMASCANLRIVSKYDSDNPAPIQVNRTSYFWGLRQPVDIKTEANCKSICQITVKTNAGHILLAAITLGIVVPQSVEYFCCPEVPIPGEI